MKYIPELWVNLFSLSKVNDQDWELSNKNKIIRISKGNVKIAFDVVIKTQTGVINAVKMIPNINNVGLVGFESKKQISASHMHKMLGHVGND